MIACCVDGSCRSEESEELKRESYYLFLTDLMCLLCQECKVPWQPPDVGKYDPPPSCSNIHKYVRNSYRKMYADIELAWFNIKKSEEEKSKNDTIKTSDADDINKMIENDYKKSAQKIIEDDNATKLNKSQFGNSINGGISETRAIQLCQDELIRRRKQLFNFLMKEDTRSVLVEILEISLTCIVLCQLMGMGDAMSSGVTEMSHAFEDYFKKTGHSFHPILDSMSCLAADLPHDNWPSEMIDKLHEVFTCDLLYFVCNIHKIPWYPPDCTSHTIDARSPLTSDIQTYIEKSLPDSEEIVTMLYFHYGRYKYALEACSFAITAMMGEISTARIPSKKSAEDLFLLVLSVTRVSVELHKCNMQGILAKTHRCLQDALRKCNEKNNGRIFDLFNAYAKLENAKGYPPRAKPHDISYFVPPVSSDKAAEIVLT